MIQKTIITLTNQNGERISSLQDGTLLYYDNIEIDNFELFLDLQIYGYQDNQLYDTRFLEVYY